MTALTQFLFASGVTILAIVGMTFLKGARDDAKTGLRPTFEETIVIWALSYALVAIPLSLAIRVLSS